MVYRDQKAGTVERVDDLEARIAAASLTGPIESAGTLVVRGVSLKFATLIGKIIHGRTVPVSLTVESPASQSKVQLNGTLVSLADTPKFKGKIKAEGSSLAAIVIAIGAAGPLPGFVGQTFAAESAVVASAEGAEIKELVVRLGDAEATGGGSVELGETLNVAGRLTVNHVNLDKWAADTGSGSADAFFEGLGEAGKERTHQSLHRSRSGAINAQFEGCQTFAGCGLGDPSNLAGSVNLVLEPSPSRTPLSARCGPVPN